MKYLREYIEDAQTELLNKYGAFFAFNKDQFNRQKKDGVKYVHIGAGLICDKTNTDALVEGLDAVHKAGIQQDIQENGKPAIIHRELANHEAQINYDWLTDLQQALDGYGITDEQIKVEYRDYMRHCVENNLI